MDIRRNEKSALPAFAALNVAWIEELHTLEPSDIYMRDYPESYTQGNNVVFSIHIDGNVAGVCALKQDDDGAYELTKMAVDARYRGQGLGQVLMDTVETYAREDLALERIYLLSNSNANDTAIRLYKRAGWRVIHEGKHPQYARCNIGMEKVFAPR